MDKTLVIGRSRTEVPLAEDLSFSGLVLGEVLYDYIRINPEVVRAVEFSRSADVDSVLSFARFADTKAALSGASLDGLHSELQGYVAEQLAAEHLTAQGHDVVFPNTANNPGWDLSVDGHPFQVKCLVDPSGVYEHLQHYPDIPVIANADLANQLGDHAGVYIDPQLHHDAVQNMTVASLDHGRNMGELDIPWISVLVSGASNIVYMIRNGTDVRGMLICTGTDTLGRTVGAIPGKAMGAGIGALLFGPAGAIVVGVVGAIAGSMAGRRLATAGRELFLFEESDAVRHAVRDVAEEALSAMPAKLEAWDRKAVTLQSCFSSNHPNNVQIQSVMVERIEEQIEYWKGKRKDLEAATKGETNAPNSLTEGILNQSRLRQFEAEFSDDKSLIDELSSQIDASEAKLQQMKRDHDLGEDVDADSYETIRRQHNKDVDTHNQLVQEYNSTLHAYKSLLSTTNEQIDRYNALLRSQ